MTLLTSSSFHSCSSSSACEKKPIYRDCDSRGLVSRRSLSNFVTYCHFFPVISAERRAGVKTGSWNRLTKSVVTGAAWFTWKRPNRSECNKEDADDMEEAETQKGESALVLLGSLLVMSMLNPAQHLIKPNTISN